MYLNIRTGIFFECFPNNSHIVSARLYGVKKLNSAFIQLKKDVTAMYHCVIVTRILISA